MTDHSNALLRAAVTELAGAVWENEQDSVPLAPVLFEYLVPTFDVPQSLAILIYLRDWLASDFVKDRISKNQQCLIVVADRRLLVATGWQSHVNITTGQKVAAGDPGYVDDDVLVESWSVNLTSMVYKEVTRARDRNSP